MDENIKKHYNITKYLFFPWGMIPATLICYGAIEGLQSLFSGLDCISIPSWIWTVLFFVLEATYFIFLIIYPRIYPKGKNNCHNFYVLIYPENIDDDKYIVDDFVSDFQSHATGIKNLYIIVPHFIKRRFFVRRIKRYKKHGKDFWKSKTWQRLHKKLGGIIYITGTLSRRNTNKKEHYVFTLSATVGYNNLNSHLTPIMVKEMCLNFPTQIILDKEFEFEQFHAFSNNFATFAEYLIGWSHLVSGKLALALEMHRDIFENKKQSFKNRGYLENLNQIIRYEGKSILGDCKKFPKKYIADCSEMLLSLFPNDEEILFSVSRSLVMNSSPIDFDENVARAMQLLKQVRINKINRATLHANKAYLLLLQEKYSQAEEEYRLLFKKPSSNVYENVISYCNEQIANGTEKEKATAYYVRVLILQKSKPRSKEFADAYEAAHSYIPGEHYYYKKLVEIAAKRKE